MLLARAYPFRARLVAAIKDWANARPLALNFFWAVVLSISMSAAYEGTNWLTAGRQHVGTWAFAWERHIPLVPLLMLPYLSMDPLFFFGFFFCTSRQELYTLVKRLAFAGLVANACFVIYPLRMQLARPPMVGVFAPLFHFQDTVDRPFNLVPSLHIVEAVVLSVIYLRHSRGWVRGFIGLWFVLICLSTVLTYQHQVIDVATGFVLAWACVRAFPERPAQAVGGNSSTDPLT